MYKEFKAIYKQEFGIDLTDGEAYEKGIRLINFAKVILNHKQKEN